MKTSRKNLFVIFVLVAAGFLSCSKEFDWWGRGGRETFAAYINEVAAPENIVAGQPAVFSVSYSKPQPCYTRTGVHTKINGFEMTLEVHLKRDHVNPCPDMLVGETAEFSAVFPLPGIYFLHYQGIEGPEILEVEVK